MNEDDGPLLVLGASDHNSWRTFRFTPQSDITAFEVASLLEACNVRFSCDDETFAKLDPFIQHLTEEEQA